MTFGRNYWGATGTVSVISTPVELVVPNTKFIQVSGSNNHYAAVTDNGELYTW
jgi:alpha-tubulin suppressor-like RCC1 family protein